DICAFLPRRAPRCDIRGSRKEVKMPTTAKKRYANEFIAPSEWAYFNGISGRKSWREGGMVLEFKEG
ncbi:MAG: hypothetical protein J7L20_03710, partial [Thermoplasmata archaeon]|nr:hypothetical protein [Thermoplasmata archaeon]